MMIEQNTQTHSFNRLILRSDVYIDSTEVTDENGFGIIEVPHTAILLNYSELLKITHWAYDDRARIKLTREQQHENARRIVACVNACVGISTESLESNEPLKRMREKASSWDELRAVYERINKELPRGWKICFEMAPDDWNILLLNPDGDCIGFNSDDVETDT